MRKNYRCRYKPVFDNSGTELAGPADECDQFFCAYRESEICTNPGSMFKGETCSRELGCPYYQNCFVCSKNDAINGSSVICERRKKRETMDKKGLPEDSAEAVILRNNKPFFKIKDL